MTKQEKLIRFGGWTDYQEWADNDFRERLPFEEHGLSERRSIVVEVLTEVAPIKVIESELDDAEEARTSCSVHRADHRDTGAGEDNFTLDLDLDAELSLVRPYVRSGGRSWVTEGLEFETVISTAQPYATLPVGELTEDERTVCRICLIPRSVAEIAVGISAPIGLALKIISEGVDRGLLRMHNTASTATGPPSMELLRRVHSGLSRLA